MTTKPISRKSGRSATASSAYRNACKMIDERTGVEHDYTKKMGVVYSECFDKDNNELDRSELWNKAELVENRKDARTAREYIIAIPDELMPDYPEPIPDLTEEEKKDSVKVDEHKLKVKQYRIESEQAINDAKSFCGIDTARDFAKALAEKYEVAVDIAIHAPDSQGNNKNWHAHIMTTTRKVELTKDGVSLTDKADIELSNKKLFELNKPKNQEQVKEVREMWSDTANRYLSDELKIDHRSYAEQGKDQVPTVKLGWKASQMEKQGIKTERGNINRAIAKDNKRIEQLKSEIIIDRGEAAKFKPQIEPLPVKKQDCGFVLYDNYNLLVDMHNRSIESLESGYYTSREATRALKSVYEVANDVYGNIDNISKKRGFNKETVEKIKESVDELTDNYTKFVNKTTLKNEPTITDAQERATRARERCLQEKPKPQAPKAEPSEESTITPRRLSF